MGGKAKQNPNQNIWSLVKSPKESMNRTEPEPKGPLPEPSNIK